MAGKSQRRSLHNIINRLDVFTTDNDRISSNLRTLLRRFTKAELVNDILSSSSTSQRFPDLSQSKRLSKERLIDSVIKLIKDTSDLQNFIIDLEIKHLQLHKDKRKWTAVEVKNPTTLLTKDTVPEKLAKILNRILKKTGFFCVVNCQYHNEAMWTVISIERQHLKPSIICLLMYPDIPLYLHTHLLKDHSEAVRRSMIQLFRATGSTELPCESRYVETLLLFSCQHLKQNTPVDIERKRRDEEDSEDEPYNVIPVNIEKEQERRSYLLETFGSFEMPAMETLSYKIDCNADNESSLPFKCHITMKGSNVLEGIRDFVQIGAADYPLPEYVEQVGTRYGNIISIKGKKPRLLE